MGGGRRLNRRAVERAGQGALRGWEGADAGPGRRGRAGSEGSRGRAGSEGSGRLASAEVWVLSFEGGSPTADPHTGRRSSVERVLRKIHCGTDAKEDRKSGIPLHKGRWTDEGRGETENGSARRAGTRRGSIAASRGDKEWRIGWVGCCVRYNVGSVRDLLRAIRNKKNHYYDLDPLMQVRYGGGF